MNQFASILVMLILPLISIVKADPDKPKTIKIENVTLYKEGLIAYPLVCGEGRDYPNGSEYLVTNHLNKEVIHIVFPHGQKADKKLGDAFTIQGYKQAIKKAQNYQSKRVPRDYQYFVVTSLK